MRFYILPWQGKEYLFREALIEGGHIEVPAIEEADFVFTHLDSNIWKQSIESFPGKIFQYPHAMNAWHHLYLGGTAWERVVCRFVASPLVKQLLLAGGYPKPIVVVGFPYTEVVLPLTANSASKILFAPAHPHEGGNLDAKSREWNREVWQILYCAKDKHVTAYVHQALENGGMFPVDNIDVVPSDLTIANAKSMIMQYDVTVSRGTFLYLAAALGKPVISYATTEPFYVDDYPDQIIEHPENMRLWKYPIDLLREHSLDDAIRKSMKSDIIRDWKDNVLGGSFQKGLFLEKLEQYLMV